MSNTPSQETTPPRDPRQNPFPGDVLLAHGWTHPILIGSIEVADDEAEIWWSAGGPAYYWTPLAEWRTRHQTSTVLYVNPEKA